jgi:phosphonopyruvate decarboxylase
MTGKDLAAALHAQGYDLCAGVPCSLVQDLIGALETHDRLPYVPAVREDLAVGIAAGATLAGGAPVVVMQNSGLGTSLNALVSLTLLYRLPALLLVTWRGYGGRDAPEHILMGEISPALLALMGVEHRVPTAATLADDVAWARAEAERRSGPVALLLPPGVVASEAPAHAMVTVEPRPPRAAPRASGAAPVDAALGPATLSRFDALGAALGAVGDAPVVHANGYICRESFAIADRPQSFYMIGSMGLAAPIALGVALAKPDATPVVFDGDGNLLMSLGILPMIGGGPLAARAWRPRLLHVVFDNMVYGSTGNQLSPSRAVELHRVARASGYATAVAVTDRDALTKAIGDALRIDGPTFVLARVTAEQRPAPRIPYTPEEIRDRFRAALRGAR